MIEVLGLVGSCVAYCGMGASMAAVSRPDWLGYPALPLRIRIEYWLFPDERPASTVELHLRRLPGAALSPEGRTGMKSPPQR